MFSKQPKAYSLFANSPVWSCEDICVGVVKLIGSSRFSGVIHIVPNCTPPNSNSH